MYIWMKFSIDNCLVLQMCFFFFFFFRILQPTLTHSSCYEECKRRKEGKLLFCRSNTYLFVKLVSPSLKLFSVSNYVRIKHIGEYLHIPYPCFFKSDCWIPQYFILSFNTTSSPFLKIKY